MIVVRFKVQSQPEKTEELRKTLTAVIAPARATQGVISFDIAQDLTDPNTFIATEVFADHGRARAPRITPRGGRRDGPAPGLARRPARSERLER